MKQPNWKTPFILSATLFVVGSFAYWLQYSHKPKQEKVDLLAKKPIALSSDEAQILMVRVKGSQGLIELNCETVAEKKCTRNADGRWVVSYPKLNPNDSTLVDATALKEFLASITNAVATEVVDLSEDSPEKRKSLFQQYGLSDDQRASQQTQFVELILADGQGKPGKRLTAWFGTEHPIGDKSFVASSIDGKINEQVVFLLSNYLKTGTFGKTLTSFRDKTLFRFNRKDVSEFTGKTSHLNRTGGQLVGVKKNGLWTINSFPANHERVETLLSGISNAKAVEFVEDSILRGLKPVVEYLVKTGNTNHSLALYEKVANGKKYYVKSSDRREIVEVESLLRTNIDLSLNELRNQNLFSETEKVTATRFKVEGKSFRSNPEFEFANGKWNPKDASRDWDASLAQKLMDLFTVSKIKDFVSPPPAGKELYQIRIGDEKNPAKFNIAVISAKNNLFARNLNEKTNEAYLMEESLSKTLPKTETEWKKKPNQN